MTAIKFGYTTDLVEPEADWIGKMFYGQYFWLRAALARTIKGWKYYYDPLKSDGLNPQGKLMLNFEDETPNCEVLKKFFLSSDCEFAFDKKDCEVFYQVFKNKRDQLKPDIGVISDTKTTRKRILEGYDILMEALEQVIEIDGELIGS